MRNISKIIHSMKTTLHFLLFILIATFSETQAQKSDSTGTTPMMKRKSQIFIAEIKTDAGIQKGILYQIDSSGIVILDSLYQRVSISLKSIKFIRINRSNSEWYGFKVGTIVGAAYIGFILTIVATTFSSLTFTFRAVLALSGFVGTTGLLFALFSKNVPNMYVDMVSEGEYFKKFNKLRSKSQRFLIEKYPNRVVLR